MALFSFIGKSKSLGNLERRDDGESRGRGRKSEG